jgi:hypothetical protein
VDARPRPPTARGGNRDGLRWNALRVLHHTAEEHTAHLRGHLPPDTNTPLGTYYDPSPSAPAPEHEYEGDDEWDRLRQAAELVTGNDLASPVMLAGRMDIGYAQAGALLRRLEDLEIVGPPARDRRREVLATPQTAAHILDEAQADHETGPRWRRTTPRSAASGSPKSDALYRAVLSPRASSPAATCSLSSSARTSAPPGARRSRRKPGNAPTRQWSCT